MWLFVAQEEYLSMAAQSDEVVSRQNFPNFLHYDSPVNKTASISSAPLPRRLSQVFGEEESRAVVVTEMHAPFRIFYVNSEWENLCGYALEECQGRTLGMLQGPETNVTGITSLIHQLYQGEEGGIILTNYTKEGRRFRNYLQVAPMKDEPFFVGVLQEIQDGK